MAPKNKAGANVPPIEPKMVKMAVVNNSAPNQQINKDYDIGDALLFEKKRVWSVGLWPKNKIYRKKIPIKPHTAPPSMGLAQREAIARIVPNKDVWKSGEPSDHTFSSCLVHF